jgi:hypothetical protein
MTIQRISVAILSTLLLAGVVQAQSAADLLQKGIHAQETVGDLDGAIQIFRQVVASPNTSKQLAAQAQYQLVLCVLQKGDRAGASRELQALEKNYSDQPALIGKARKLIPGGDTVLPAPWLDGELSQLNIKRDGTFTGETLTYSADPWRKAVGENNSSRPPDATYPDSVFLRWELTTAKSTRSIQVRVDRDTLRPLGKPELRSDDILGDESVTPFLGPAIDLEESVFTIRRLPLAVGYKTTIPVTAASPIAIQRELSVTGIEPVQVSAGKFNCYKVSIGGTGQTLWIAVDGARSMVKFQSGNTDAELVKVWGANDWLESALEFVKAAGWFVGSEFLGPGPTGNTEIGSEFGKDNGIPAYVKGTTAHVYFRRIYTPTAEIPRALEQSISEAVRTTYYGVAGNNVVRSIRPGSMQTRLINGQHAALFLIDVAFDVGHDGVVSRNHETDYCALIQTENSVIEFQSHFSSDQSLAVFRWQFDPVLATAKIP